GKARRDAGNVKQPGGAEHALCLRLLSVARLTLRLGNLHALRAAGADGGMVTAKRIANRGLERPVVVALGLHGLHVWIRQQVGEVLVCHRSGFLCRACQIGRASCSWWVCRLTTTAHAL